MTAPRSRRRGAPARAVRRASTLPALVALVVLVLGGCASFPDDATGPFRDNPALGAERAPSPQLPESPEPPPPAGGGGGGPAVPAPCVDPDPQVVATCLAPVAAVVTLPGTPAALVAERTTGRILRVAPDQPVQEVATVDVDAAGDGGLTGLTLSPTYDEDGLLYVYATRPDGNAVLRVAADDVPKPVLTGIPRGSEGNRGALGVEPDGTLLVATGDAGDAAAASAPGTLAGKLLRIDPFGRPAGGNPDPASPVVGTGLHSPGDVCPDPASSTTWVTDRAPARDVLLSVRPALAPGPAAAAAPAWTWPERPGVTGCAVASGTLVVSLTDAAGLFVLRPTAEGTFVGAPETVLQNTYGRFTGADLGADGLVWVGTANTAPGGDPTPTDDRVIRIRPPSGGASGAE